MPPIPSPVGKSSNTFASGLIIPLIAVLGMSSFFFMSGFGQNDRTLVVIALLAVGVGSALPTVLRRRSWCCAPSSADAGCGSGGTRTTTFFACG
jgi:hypothetical protein